MLYNAAEQPDAGYTFLLVGAVDDAMKRIPSLDGLRAISVALVIAGHLTHRHSGPMVILAALGVQVFFVISGFLITGLLQREHERTDHIDLPAFYRRRCFRIFPAAFAYILLTAALWPEVRSGLPYALTYTVSYHYLGTPEKFRHLWSLSIEEQFYLLWPLALAIGYRYRAAIAWSTIGCESALRLLCAIHHQHIWLLGTMDSIAAGCLLAIYASRIKERLAWLLPNSGGVAIALPFTCWTLASVLWAGWLATLWSLVPLLIAAWVFLLVERRDWILNNPAVCGIGVLSYSLYLWQQPFTTDPGCPSWMALLFLFAAALASYLCIEKPLIKLGKRLADNRQAGAPRMVATTGWSRFRLRSSAVPESRDWD